MPKIGIGGTGNIDHVQMDEQASTPSTPGTGKSAIYLKSDGLYVIDDAGAVTGPLVSSAGSGYTEGARVYHNANQSINDSTTTKLAFNSERYDTDTIHDTVTNNSRLTCQTAGKYMIVGNVEFAADVDGTRILNILLNNTTVIGNVHVGASSSSIRLVVSTIYDLSATDYVELQVFHTAGAALNVTAAGNHSPEFMMQRIG